MNLPLSETHVQRVERWTRELEREIAMRERVYPRWVAQGKMREAEAERRIDTLREILDYLTEELE